MKKYEYKYIEVKAPIDMKDENISYYVEQELNVYGQEGWCLFEAEDTARGLCGWAKRELGEESEY